MSPAKPLAAARIFKAAEASPVMSDAAFRKVKDGLRLDLIRLQQKIRAQGRFPVILVLAGVKGAGVIDTLNVINTWVDPRWVETQAFDGRSEEERERPAFWRYWRSLPAAGSMGLYLEGWYGELLGLDPARPANHRDERLRHIANFERMLADDGALILKFWLHISREEQLKRFKARVKEAVKHWKLTSDDWHNRKNWNAYYAAANEMLKRTSTETAPWQIVPANSKRYARIAIMDTVATALETALEEGRRGKRKR